MDENEFFRRASHEIHSSLEVETAMARCSAVLREVMPAKRLWLFLFDREAATLRLIAQASDEHGRRIDQVLQLSADAARSACSMDDEHRLVESVPHLGATALSRELRDVFGFAVGSYLAMLLEIEGKRLAYIAVSSPTEHSYDDGHARLFHSLKGAFSLMASHALRHEEVLRLTALLDDDKRYLQEELLRSSGEAIVGETKGLAHVMTLVRQVAASASPVLVLGETGVGKELIAKALHRASPRRDGPLITVNCGAMPESLLDDELFGHEKGAFTGAVASKRGRFERAHRGTLFLDEVGELPPSAQVRLLRVLSEKQIERVGGTETVPVDVRVVAATHRDLPAMVRAGTFREDLWFRLAVFPVEVPPLRDRRDDIPDLVRHFVQAKARELRVPAPRLAAGALDALVAHDWPGNVRELENLVERAIILDRRGPLRLSELLRPLASTSLEPVNRGAEPIKTIDDLVAGHVRATLERTEGRIHGPGGAAELLGVNASTLRARMDKLGIAFGRRRLRKN